MLLFWGILESSGSASNVCAIRFSAPVCIQTLRIFPSGAQPFKSKEDIVATTEPESLYLDVFFNAQPVGVNAKSKAKPTNTLVTTSIAYQGGQMDFNVNTERAEFATRIMVIRGKFTKLSLAAYGTALSDPTPPTSAYEPHMLRQVQYTPIPASLDPANNINPGELARSLLKLIPDAPDLRLIIRLMFCLKPSNDDWEEKDFPHLYSDLEKDRDELNLDKAVEMTARPVSDNVEEDVLKDFAQRLGDSVIDYNDDDAYLLAKLLSQSAPQHPLLIHHIITNIDLTQMYDTPTNLDRPTLLYLLDAASSLDVSQQLKSEQTLNTITLIRDSGVYDDGARRAAARLLERIQGWDILEDALSNTQAPFEEAALMMKETALEENSFGIWLENMISNPEVTDRLLDNPISTPGILRPPSLWSNEKTMSHKEFIAFVRAVIGVAAVIAVYAWSDSVPVYNCRERALGVLRFWQTVSGYKEIVNHLLLMRQMTYRLECMLPLEDDLPSHGGIDAEHILKALATQPEAYLRADFVKVMQNLQGPLNYISNDELADLRQVSAMAKDGLVGAIHTIVRELDGPNASQSRLELRVAVATVMAVIEKQANGEQQIMDALWAEGYNGLSAYLLGHLARNVEALRSLFSLNIPPGTTYAELSSLFRTCLDILRLVMRLIIIYPLAGRYLSSLTSSIADIFVYTDSADMTYPQESSVCEVAHRGRQACIDAIAYLFFPSRNPHAVQWNASTILKALLTHAVNPADHDATHHLVQVFWLLDHALPFDNSRVWTDSKSRQDWIRQNLPPVLSDLRTFYNMLEVDNKVHLIRRLKELDEGCVGLAEWLLLAEQQSLAKSIETVLITLMNPEQRIALWQINASFSVLASLIQQTSTLRAWTLDLLLKDEEQVALLHANIGALLDTKFCLECAELFITELVAARCSDLDTRIRTLVLGMLCRSSRCRRFGVFEYLSQLFHETNESLFDEKTAREFGEALEEVGRSATEDPEGMDDQAETVFHVLEQVTPLDNSKSILALLGLTEDSLNAIMSWMTNKLPVGQSTKLEAMRLRWTVMGEPRAVPEFIQSSGIPEMLLDQWENLLKPPAPVPSTPTRRSPAQSAEMLGMVTVSPPNAMLRSPEVKGLTKTYQNNDFRQLRQSSATRQNTSRLPSTHVDDFELSSSAGVAPLNLSSSPPAPLSFNAVPQRPVPLDLSLPMNPMFYQNTSQQ